MKLEKREKKAVSGLFSTKGIAITAVVVALLIGAQFVLSFVPGVEVVTLIFSVFCVVFGPVYGVIAALAFSLLRMLIYGFEPSVAILYLTYYPAFAIVTGFYGKLLRSANYRAFLRGGDDENSEKPAKKGLFVVLYVGFILLVGILTCTFTLIDDVVTPIMMGFGESSTRLYFYRSLPVMATQVTCAVASCVLLFYPVWIVVEKIKRSMRI